MALRDILVSFGITVDQTQLVDAQRNVNGLVIQLKQLQRIAGFAFAAIGIGVITEGSDAYATMANRLKAVTDSAEEFATAEQGVFQIARDVRRPVEDVAAAFGRYTTATKNLGLTQDETLDFTKRLTQAIVLGGATAAENQGALVQFGQGIANNFKSGGQEINSLIEQAPKLAHILAQAVGGPKATAHQLKAMAKEGKLTGDVVVKAVRAMGSEFDKAFAKRTLKFEEINILFGIEWMALMKQLAPTMALVTAGLKDIVVWVREWVAKGEAMNTMIAGLIVLVGTLAFAFGGLAVQLALAAAPFIALFLIIEDFVTFMRGGDSVIGDFFDALFGGAGGQNAARDQFKELWELLKQFISFLADPNSSKWEAFYNNAKVWLDKLVVLVQESLHSIAKFIEDDPVLGGLSKLMKLASGKQDALSEVMDVDANDVRQRRVESGINPDTGQPLPGNEAMAGDHSPILRSIAEFIGWGDDLRAARARAGVNPEDPTQPLMGGGPMLPGDIAATTNNNNVAAPLTVNNNITVEGSATPATARDVATKAGSATVTAVGRDRSAIGASFGLAG